MGYIMINQTRLTLTWTLSTPSFLLHIVVVWVVFRLLITHKLLEETESVT